MSLNYELSKITNWKELCYRTAEQDVPMSGIKAGDRVMNPITQTIIFGCMGTGIGEITDANAEEWACRYILASKAGGYDPDLTLADVRAHVGLTTNVFPKVSNAEFAKRLMSLTAEELRRAERRAMAVAS